ncbi:MAG: hypothetical protein ABI723_12840 [Bacteroidia bacterium]
MISKRLKYFSMFMAVLMFATSVGITAKVHYCLMEKQQIASSQKVKDCCTQKEMKSCCEMTNKKICTDDLKKDKGCCSDEVKSFSFITEFVNKIVSVQLVQFVILLSYAIVHHLADAEQQHSSETKNIFPPPKLSGTALLAFKQVLNL